MKKILIATALIAIGLPHYVQRADANNRVDIFVGDSFFARLVMARLLIVGAMLCQLRLE